MGRIIWHGHSELPDDGRRPPRSSMGVLTRSASNKPGREASEQHGDIAEMRLPPLPRGWAACARCAKPDIFLFWARVPDLHPTSARGTTRQRDWQAAVRPPAQAAAPTTRRGCGCFADAIALHTLTLAHTHPSRCTHTHRHCPPPIPIAPSADTYLPPRLGDGGPESSPSPRPPPLTQRRRRS
ncbi:hypothetical protein BD414DRAFT_484963 [Trametes punicea]|nr:hypothetical protein BD414DRAFT_484963 [Trametes punicea]